MKLTETFSKKVESIRDKIDLKRDARRWKKRARVNERLEAWADKLPAEIGKHGRRGAKAHTIAGLGRYDATSFSGYKRLHEICAAANVKIEVIRFSSDHASIGVSFGQPYSKSPDAGILEPKKPVAVQLKFQGL